jgi:hypothetical protein
MVMGYAFQNLLQSADFYWSVIWDYLMVLAIQIRCQPNMRASLPSYFIPQNTERTNQLAG